MRRVCAAGHHVRSGRCLPLGLVYTRTRSRYSHAISTSPSRFHSWKAQMGQ